VLHAHPRLLLTYKCVRAFPRHHRTQPRTHSLIPRRRSLDDCHYSCTAFVHMPHRVMHSLIPRRRSFHDSHHPCTALRTYAIRYLVRTDVHMSPATYHHARAERAGPARRKERSAASYVHGNIHARGFALPDRRCVGEKSTFTHCSLSILCSLSLFPSCHWSTSGGIGRRGEGRLSVCIRCRGPSTRGGKLR
jgi:hypothetical protein